MFAHVGHGGIAADSALAQLLSDAALVAVVAPFVAFAVVLVGGALARERGFGGGASSIIAAGSAAVSLALSLLMLAEVWSHFESADTSVVAYSTTWVESPAGDLTAALLVDPLSALMASIVSLVALLALVFSRYYMNAEGEPGLPRYYASMSLFTGSMLAFVLSDNLLMSFVFFELVGLCSYLLIGFWFDRPPAASAAKKAFLVTRFGDYFFLVGVVSVFAAFGTFSYHGTNSLFASARAAMDLGLPVLGLPAGTGVTVVAVLILGGVVGKSAQFPLHDWLPDAMEGPTPVSALIHAATMVAAGVYLVARLFELYALSPAALALVAFVGGFTALFAASMALVRDDIKQVLAYSTISQYGYMMLALGAGGYTAGVFHLMNHAFFKALLFLGAGSVIIAMHHEQDMWNMGGLRERMPVTYWTFLAGSLALAGIAPFSGFWSKDEALLAALTNASNQPLLWIPLALGLVGVVVTGAYTFRMVALTFHGEPRTEEAEDAEEGGLAVYVPLVVLGVLAVVSGFVNAEPLGLHALADYLGSSSYYTAASVGAGYAAEIEPNLVLTALSLVLAVAGAAAGFSAYRRSPERLKRRAGAFVRAAEDRYYVDRLYDAVAVDVTYRFSRALGAFDLDVVDGLVNAVSTVSLGSGDALRRIQSGVVSHYALIITIGTVVLALIVGAVGGWF